MANLSITAAEVLPVTGSTAIQYGIAGAAISAGDVCYFENSSATWKLFDSNDVAANTKTPAVALSSAAIGQPLGLATGGDITIGATAAATTGDVYVASATAGKMAPAAQPESSGSRLVVIGAAKGSNKMALILSNTGVTP